MQRSIRYNGHQQTNDFYNVGMRIRSRGYRRWLLRSNVMSFVLEQWQVRGVCRETDGLLERNRCGEGVRLQVIVLFWQRHSLGLYNIKRSMPNPNTFTFRILLTCASSRLYCSMRTASTSTSAGARAGAATNSSDGLLEAKNGMNEMKRA